MSIQSTINQGINIATALYTQTPEFKDRAELRQIDKEIKQRVKGYEAANRELNKDVEEGTENIYALSEAKDNAKGAQKKAFNEDIKKEEEKLDISKKTSEQMKDKYFEKLKTLGERKAEITGDFGGYYQMEKEAVKKMIEANKRAEEKKAIKNAQSLMTKQTSLGGSLSEFDFKPEVLKKIEEQIGGKK